MIRMAIGPHDCGAAIATHLLAGGGEGSSEEVKSPSLGELVGKARLDASDKPGSEACRWAARKS